MGILPAVTMMDASMHGKKENERARQPCQVEGAPTYVAALPQRRLQHHRDVGGCTVGKKLYEADA